MIWMLNVAEIIIIFAVFSLCIYYQEQFFAGYMTAIEIEYCYSDIAAVTWSVLIGLIVIHIWLVWHEKKKKTIDETLEELSKEAAKIKIKMEIEKGESEW
jgi:uncharacterized membrane protein